MITLVIINFFAWVDLLFFAKLAINLFMGVFKIFLVGPKYFRWIKLKFLSLTNFDTIYIWVSKLFSHWFLNRLCLFLRCHQKPVAYILYASHIYDWHLASIAKFGNNNIFLWGIHIFLKWVLVLFQGVDLFP